MDSKISRRTFNSKVLNGVKATALLGSMPIACTVAESNKKKLGVALVGLGEYSTSMLAPALLQTKHCELAGIVTGTPEKAKQWSDKYNIPEENIYNYDNFDAISQNKAIDIVYVVLPNAMHADFSIRAAKAGKHVICEKPMAVNIEECEAIISACQKADVRLGVGYRLHSEPYTQEVKRMVAEQTFGKTHFASAEAAYLSGSNWDQWRFDKALSGGGALMNMGVYAIQGALYAIGENPIAVMAQEFSTLPEKFKDTDETITAQLEFPNGAVASIFTSHNARADRLYASCQKGWFELDTAYTYGPLHGRTSEGIEIKYAHFSQQALQMDDFALHITKGAPNKAPGEMGLRDIKIVTAIYQSIEEKRKVDLNL